MPHQSTADHRDAELFHRPAGGEAPAFNLTVDQRPHTIAYPRDEAEVVRVVRYAAERDLRIAAQRTGHAAAALGPLTQTLLMRTDRMPASPVIDPESRRVRVGAGALWHPVIAAAGSAGLLGLHGTAAGLGVVGYTLGGGLSWYGRRYGLAANRVTAVEVVTADGEVERVSHHRERDLFWALRGGGGSFGIVTALEFELLPLDTLHAGAFYYPWSRAREILGAWREWAADVPDGLTSIARLMRLPDRAAVPAALRSCAFAVIEVVHLGARASELIDPLRRLRPALDTFGPAASAEIADLHMDPPVPIPYLSEDGLVSELPPAALDALVSGFESKPALGAITIRHTGGALARADGDHGALATLPGSFAVSAAGLVVDEASGERVRPALAMVRDAIAPTRVGAALNFTERTVDPASFFDPDTLARLRRIKHDVDPGEVFHANHPIAPA